MRLLVLLRRRDVPNLHDLHDVRTLNLKYPKGNVFSRICQSFCSRRRGVSYTLVQCPGPANPRCTGPYTRLRLPDMFKLLKHGPHHTRTPLPRRHLIKHFDYKASTACKRAVDIPLKCLLVSEVFSLHQD